ncbi:MAG: DUF3341 domain-containing protein [Planctomycetota bacterium]|nr:DUF3341 domain-containing protein [Planctomycetota bacterium]
MSEVKGARAQDRHDAEHASGHAHATAPAPEIVPEPALAAPTDGATPWGVIARYDDGDALKRAAATLRDAGYDKYDAHSPYPVHGMRRAMGQGRSPLGWWTLGGAAFGALAGFLIQWYPSVVEYPLIVGGKAYDSWPAFVPIVFELSILFGAFATIFGLFKLSRQPQLYHPTHGHDPFRRVTDDGFFLVVETEDARFDAERTPRLLARSGGRDVAWVEV